MLELGIALLCSQLCRHSKFLDSQFRGITGSPNNGLDFNFLNSENVTNPVWGRGGAGRRKLYVKQ
jgi:hypothetical protein